jgi:hypothetical protein
VEITAMLQINVRGQSLTLSEEESRAANAMKFLAPSQRVEAYAGYRDRAESLELIITALSCAAAPMTRAQIAKAIGRKKSTYVTGMINQLADAGRIFSDVRPNKWKKWEHVYWIERRGRQ